MGRVLIPSKPRFVKRSSGLSSWNESFQRGNEMTERNERNDGFIGSLSDRDAEAMLKTLLAESGYDAEAEGLTVADLDAALRDSPDTDDGSVPERGDLCRFMLSALRENPSDVSQRLATEETARELLATVVP